MMRAIDTIGRSTYNMAQQAGASSSTAGPATLCHTPETTVYPVPTAPAFLPPYDDPPPPYTPPAAEDNHRPAPLPQQPNQQQQPQQQQPQQQEVVLSSLDDAGTEHIDIGSCKVK